LEGSLIKNTTIDLDVSKIISICNDSGISNITDVLPYTKGYGHLCWYIKTRTNKSYLFKVNIRNSSKQKFNNEIYSLQFALKKGIHVPGIYSRGELENETFKYYYIQEWVRGEDASSYLKKVDHTEKQHFFFNFGSEVANLHSIEGTYFSEDIIGTNKYKSIKELSKLRLDRTIDFLLSTTILPKALLLEIEQKINKKILQLPGEILPCFTHGDLHLGNIIVTEEDKLFFIDFESSKFYDPILDFFKLDLWVFQEYSNYYDDFIKGYNQNRNLGNLYEERFSLYKSIEYIYCINYFGNLYRDEKMLKQFIDLLVKWNNEN